MANLDPVPSSSAAFGTPIHPVRIGKVTIGPVKTSILPILLPPATLRPIAFRTFTKKHNLTISSPALQLLADFVGRNCGSGWREEGLAERVLDEVAKMWKKTGGGVIVEESSGISLKGLLQTLEGNMSGGRVLASRHGVGEDQLGRSSERDITRKRHSRLNDSRDPHDDFTTQDDEDDDDSAASRDPRKWIKVIGAFDQPRLVYNPNKKHFEASASKPSLFPHPSHKATMFRERYNLVHQRLLRNESFETSSFGNPFSSSILPSSALTAQQTYKLTPIANLLGRNGTSYLLLGLLSVSPTGELSLTDLTGSIVLDLTHARAIPEDGAWYAPGMIILVDGIYEEAGTIKGHILGGNSGVGGVIDGRFVAVSIGGPPCERREVTLGSNTRHSSGDVSISGGFGWINFLGVGSERAHGLRMRRIESKCFQREQNDKQDSSRRTMVVMSEVNLDNIGTLEALQKIFRIYNSLPLNELPLVFFIIGNFVRNALTGGNSRGNSIEYKELFDSLASILADYQLILRHSTFVCVPGDNDPWASTFSRGAATALPREPIPELFTSRIKRAFSAANHDSDRSATAGDIIWTTNPTRLSMFGPVHEVVVLRDDVSGRLRRSSVINKTVTSKTGDETPQNDHGNEICEGGTIDRFSSLGQREKSDNPPSVLATRKLVKTILDQGTMSPFPLSTRPVLWDYASSLQLYPLPTALVLADADAAPFIITYEGCHVMNPGRLLPENQRNVARWVEYDVLKNRGIIREERY